MGVTTCSLFAACMVYLVASAIYSCLCRRHRRRGGGDLEAGELPRPAVGHEEAIRCALAEMPVEVYGLEGGGGEEACCAVCLAEYAAGEEVRVLPGCRHAFHRQCVDRSLLARAPTCPVCRANDRTCGGPSE